MNLTWLQRGWIVLLLLLAGLALSAAEEIILPSAYRTGTFTYGGKSIDRIVVPSRPPVRTRMPVAQVSAADPGAVLLPEVPAFDWSYGCSPTSASMMMGYYDRGSFPNMYAGPANGGVCPLTNAVWGSGECPLSATHQGKDGRAARGHVDDYWIGYDNSDNDPYITNSWSEHAAAECTADFMGTNMSRYGHSDGSTTFYNYTDGSPLTSYAGCEPGDRDGCHGIDLFLQSRGYTATAVYSQYIKGYEGNTLGFTFDDYKAEIDAGRPVIIQVSGHTMLGLGYNTTGNLVYLHDTWDYNLHSMTWGGSYSGMQHYGVVVIRLQAPAASYQPDLRLRLATDGSYIGDGTYNTTGVGQSRGVALPQGMASNCYVYAQNDANATDTLTVTATGGAAGFTVQCFQMTTGTNLTAQMTGAGYTTDNLLPGDSRGFYIKITAAANVAAGTTCTVTVTATSAGDGTKQDVAKFIATAAGRQPDLRLRTAAEGSYSGDNLISADGATQAKALSIAVAKPAVYYLYAQNDGTVADTLKVTATAGSGAWTVQYLQMSTGTDLTAAMTGAGWSTGALAPGALSGFYVKVTPSIAAAANEVCTLTITAVSAADASKKDVAKLVTTALQRRPDLSLRLPTEGSYAGDTVYNTTGVDQSRAAAVAAGKAAVCYIRAQNDGAITDTLKLTASAAPAGWTVQYLQMSTQTDLTTAMTGAGYTLGPLAPAGFGSLYIKATPGSGVTAGSAITLTLTLTSTADSTKQDVVKFYVTGQ